MIMKREIQKEYKKAMHSQKSATTADRYTREWMNVA